MRFLIVMMLSLATTFCYSQDEELKQLEIMQTICKSSVVSQNDSLAINQIPNLSKADDSPMSLSLEINANLNFNARVVQKFETYAVRIDFFDGYKFHVADYYDGTCIVTSLDGPLLGYQVISVYGTVTADSSNVVWRKNHFVHRYPNGKVLTYERMQVIELN